ncbi:MAG: transcriptional repressor [Bacteroidota bacterium]
MNSKSISKSLQDSSYYIPTGGNYSATRIQVIEAFLANDSPINAENLWLNMRALEQRVSLSSVYNALNWLVKQQLCTKLKNAKDVWIYC